MSKAQKVGGNGGFHSRINADPDARRFYVARRADQASGQPARITVYDLDSLAQVGEILNVSAHGVALDPEIQAWLAEQQAGERYST